PNYSALKPQFMDETAAFIDTVLIEKQGSLRALLTAGFSIVSPELAQFYNVPVTSDGRTSLSGSERIGILQQASFLATHARGDESGPVTRGVAVLKRLLCRKLPNPAELGIQVLPPAADPSRTTRERFAAHSQDAACRTCHRSIDPPGFAFENFDASGG